MWTGSWWSGLRGGELREPQGGIVGSWVGMQWVVTATPAPSWFPLTYSGSQALLAIALREPENHKPPPRGRNVHNLWWAHPGHQEETTDDTVRRNRPAQQQCDDFDY